MEDLPKLYTLKEVLEHLRGTCGRTFLMHHLHKVPYFDGGPTHRRLGSKFVFLSEDFERLLNSLAPAPAASDHIDADPYPAAKRGRRVMPDRPTPSAERQFEQALKLVAKIRAGTKSAKKTTRRKP